MGDLELDVFPLPCERIADFETAPGPHDTQIVEGYPVDPKKGEYPDAYIYTGAMPAFLQAGFIEVLRRSETHP